MVSVVFTGGLPESSYIYGGGGLSMAFFFVGLFFLHVSLFFYFCLF